MKYCKNLIRRKKHKILIICLCVFLLGTFILYMNFKDMIINDIGKSSMYTFSPFTDVMWSLISYTNIGSSLMGIYLIYFGLIWIPTANGYAQDDSDFDVKSEGENIHIFFKKYEFLVKKETFGPTKLFFRDKNNRFVSILRGYQVYNYVNTMCKRLTEKEINQSKVILKAEVVDKFSNVKKMSDEEKLEFIRKQKLKSSPNIFFTITSIILWAGVIFWLFGVISFTLKIDIKGIIVSLIMSILSYLLAKQSNKAMLKDKKLKQKILNEDMYTVDCKVYDKKHTSGADNDGGSYDYYYIKITDGNYIVDQWIEISEEKYREEDNYDVKLYILDKTGSDYFLIS